MRRYILAILPLLLCLTELSAQEPTQQVDAPVSQPVKEFISSFTAIEVDAPIKLTLIKIESYEAPYIIYDTKGVFTSKFSAEVDKKSSTLKISERNDPKRTSITEVKVFFNSLTDIHISKADTTVEGTINSQLLDIHISNDANFIADIDVLDIMLSVSGKSRVVLTGATRYQTADISTAEYDGARLTSVSTTVESSHSATARVYATERLSAKTSTGGKVLYRSEPVILRTEITLFGGEILRM